MAELVFTVDSALLSELGDKLVETPHIALVELVKNAYDADATQVTVKIVPDPPRGPEVHVIDNGSGMSFADVQNYWMRIATTHKLDRPVSRNGTGLDQTEVSFDWLKFKPGREISTIICEGSHRQVKDAIVGTTLIIRGNPVDEWSKRGYDFLNL